MNNIGTEKGIIKVIDGELYYKSHYCYWLYKRLEENDTELIKILSDNKELLKTYDDLEEQYKLLMKQVNKAIKDTKELYEIAKEQDRDNVNLIDRLEIILKILRGKDT